MSVVLQIIVNGLLSAAFIALVAAGISFVHATNRLFHLAHGAVVVGAGFAFWFAWIRMGWHPVLAVLFACVIAVAAGLAMHEFVYEVLRARGTKGIGYLIATLALLILGTSVIQLLFGSSPKTLQFQTATHTVAGVSMTTLQLATITIAAVLLALFQVIVAHTRFGTAMRATADNDMVAAVLGINTRAIRRGTIVLASLLAAPAGILIGLELALDQAMAVFLAVSGFAATVIGGSGVLMGAVVGSIIIGLGEQVTVWFWGAGWRKASTFVLLFLFLLLKPGGIFGRRNGI